jgi:hypothetical protein
MAVSEYTRSYNSFSGVDIQATFGGKLIGELQGVSYSITREKAPIYTLGSADPRSFSRGKRGIAGTLVFTIFDRTPIIETLKENTFYAHRLDIYKQEDPAYRGIRATEEDEVIQNDVYSDNDWYPAWYPDQLPPFDIVLTAANEYGQIAKMSIFACEILNEGTGISVDDIVTEQEMTFVARRVTPWQARASESRSS